MRIVATHNFDDSVIKTGFYQACYLDWIHIGNSLRNIPGARSVPGKRRASHRRTLIVYDNRLESVSRPLLCVQFGRWNRLAQQYENYAWEFF
jgi:hypothetical protein